MGFLPSTCNYPTQGWTEGVQQDHGSKAWPFINTKTEMEEINRKQAGNIVHLSQSAFKR